MQIKQVMTSNPTTCHPDTNLAIVVRKMWEHDCGFVPVVDAGGQIVGVLTDRDICIASATRRLLPEQLTAAQVMHPAPIHTVHANNTAEKALSLMRQYQIRRLPVVDDQNTLLGVVSMNDLVLASEEKRDPNANEVVDTLSAICAHHAPVTTATM